MKETDYLLVCPECGGEVYYENPKTGNGKYNCDCCGFSGDEKDFNYSIPAKYIQGGIDLILAERRRQIEKEDYTAEHDQQHKDGELAIAAACYALPEAYRHYDLSIYDVNHNPEKELGCPNDWPWNTEFWKPTPDNRIRELTKAGALIAAEIDRLKALQQEPEGEKE